MLERIFNLEHQQHSNTGTVNAEQEEEEKEEEEDEKENTVLNFAVWTYR